jgi:8-oxo-dGTP pyrophosphatase MutT (NUDIX family)
MRIVERKIVGAFIFSKDKKILLGFNREGGAYQDKLVVPGGGIETGETELEAVQREILEETGIDISAANISPIKGTSTGESEVTLQTGEVVMVKMIFSDFEVHLGADASLINLKFDDDYLKAEWFTAKDLVGKNIGSPTKASLQKLHFL